MCSSDLVSGAHFNPLVTLSSAIRGKFSWGLAWSYLTVQLLGALLGVMLAHVMFAEPRLLAPSAHVRSGAAQWLSEGIATFGLLTVIASCGRRSTERAAVAVGLYIAAAYWFTASTSFANPAATIARSFTPTFVGIRPVDAPAFVIAQTMGAAASFWVSGWLFPEDAGSLQEME